MIVSVTHGAFHMMHSVFNIKIEGDHCRVFNVHTDSFTSTLYVRDMAPPFNVVMRATGEYTTMCVLGESPDTMQALPQGPSRLALEGRYAFHMVFQ